MKSKKTLIQLQEIAETLGLSVYPQGGSWISTLKRSDGWLEEKNLGPYVKTERQALLEAIGDDMPQSALGRPAGSKNPEGSQVGRKNQGLVRVVLLLEPDQLDFLGASGDRSATARALIREKMKTQKT